MLKLNKDYSDYTDESDENYPEGKAINASSSESYDGTPVLAELLNDINAGHIATYEMAYGDTSGISGMPDTQKKSQFADAIAKYTNDKVKDHDEKRGLSDGVHGATSSNEAGQIITRDASGRAKISPPLEDDDLTNKKWVYDLVMQAKKDAILEGHPVKSLFWTEDPDFNPNTEWGGTWVRIKSRFIYAAGDNDVCGSVGGEATHTLTEAEMPRHSHGGSVAATNINHSHSISHTHTRGSMEITGDFALNTSQGIESATGAFAESSTETQYVARFAGTTPVNPSTVGKSKFTASRAWTGSTSDASNTSSGTMSQNAEHSHTINPSGSSTAHNNMPPYEVSICWKRTA